MSEERPTNEMIERLEARLSEEGTALMEELLDIGPEGDQEAAAELIERMKARLPRPERETILKLMDLRAQAHRERMEHHMEAIQHSEIAMGVFRRASELTGGKLPEGATLEQAIQVLESHGERAPDYLDTSRVIHVPES